ncbi:MAG: hypothetical protein KC422_17955 [Trueperaceae bacterium]|nr:hypothetical protein [Trueperaceae bacterium]
MANSVKFRSPKFILWFFGGLLIIFLSVGFIFISNQRLSEEQPRLGSQLFEPITKMPKHAIDETILFGGASNDSNTLTSAQADKLEPVGISIIRDKYAAPQR